MNEIGLVWGLHIVKAWLQQELEDSPPLGPGLSRFGGKFDEDCIVRIGLLCFDWGGVRTSQYRRQRTQRPAVQAVEFAASIERVVLVDGARLAELMIDHEVG